MFRSVYIKHIQPERDQPAILLQQLIQGQKEKQDRKTNNDPQITTPETEY
jgi:hypothetical protein